MVMMAFIKISISDMRITEEGWTEKKNTNHNLMINTSSRVLDKKCVLNFFISTIITHYIEYEI